MPKAWFHAKPLDAAADSTSSPGKTRSDTAKPDTAADASKAKSDESAKSVEQAAADADADGSKSGTDTSAALASKISSIPVEQGTEKGGTEIGGTEKSDGAKSSTGKNSSAKNGASKNNAAKTSAEKVGPEKTETAAVGSSSRAKPPADSQALLDALQQLQVIGAIDTETQQRMIADLKQTDPALWPQLLQYYRASATMHKKPDRHAVDVLSRADQQSAASAAGPAAASDSTGEPPMALNPPVQGSMVLASATSSVSAPASPAVPPQNQSAAVQNNQVATPQAANIAPAAAVASVQEIPPAARAGAAPEPDDPNSWEDHLHAAIAGLELATREPPKSSAEAGRHAALRMLYMIDGRKEDALKPIRGISPGQQDFWSQEIYGLANYLDTDRNPDSSRRAAEAVDRLREAANKLGEQATLSVKNLAFCTEVTSFGVYKPFTKDEYKAGQEVLLYAEVENFKSRRDEKGYQTALRSSYQILDQHGARVESQDFEVTEEHCQNLRRDFFMRYHIWMPKRIYGGRYTLQLTIEDTLSQKIGQSSLEFTVKE